MVNFEDYRIWHKKFIIDCGEESIISDYHNLKEFILHNCAQGNKDRIVYYEPTIDFKNIAPKEREITQRYFTINYLDLCLGLPFHTDNHHFIGSLKPATLLNPDFWRNDYDEDLPTA